MISEVLRYRGTGAFLAVSALPVAVAASCFFFLIACGLRPSSESAPAWKSGEAIPVGSAHGRGPFSAGLTSWPAGTANVTGGKRPDLFVAAGRLSNPTGMFLYPWKADGPDDAPIFGERIQISIPIPTESTPRCTVTEAQDRVWAFCLQPGEIVAATLDWPNRTFAETERILLTGLPLDPSNLLALPREDGKWTFIVSVSDGKGGSPPGPGSRKPEYVPYDGAGIWRGGTARSSLWEFIPGQTPRQISRPGEEILWTPGTLTAGSLGAGHEHAVISGSWFGNIYYFPNKASQGVDLGERLPAVDESGVLLRHPLAGTYPAAYPNVSGSATDLIAGGEGCLQFYRFTGRFTKQGNPVFRKPVPVLQEPAKLNAGTLPVPTIADWDGDGALDIVAGNSEGRILFFRNRGTNRLPALEPGVALQAGAREIHVQPGYKGDIQGPGEARWGYISPNVYDWNGDGLPDILASDSTSRHYVYLNIGTKRAPKLDHEHMLYLDGLDLHGSWRVRPGAGRLGNRVAYIALDDDDEFHLYYRLDNFNLSDGGKLSMEDGTTIKPNFLFAGGTGRSKIELVDWDEDGAMDLLVGTPKHHSIPNPETGLPRALGMPGTSVLFLKNTGTNEKPAFRFPEVLSHQGKNIYLGHHEIGASVGELGPGNRKNLIVSREDGSLYFFQREEMK